MAYLVLIIMAAFMVAGVTFGIVLAGVGIVADVFLFAVKCGIVMIPLMLAFTLAKVLFGL